MKEADVIDKVIFKFAGGIPLDIDGNPVEGAEGPGWLVGAEGEVEETAPGPIGDGMSFSRLGQTGGVFSQLGR